MIESKRLVEERGQRLQKLGPRPPWWRPIRRRRWKRQRAAILAMDTSAVGELLRSMYPKERIMEMASRPGFSTYLDRISFDKEPSPK